MCPWSIAETAQARQCGTSGARWSLAGVSGTRVPSSLPNRAPFAPGNRPKS